METITNSTQETKKVAEELAGHLEPGDIIALYGDLGSGKTTFTKYLVEALSIKSRVQSPTFVVVRKYSGTKGKIRSVNHVDLYRFFSREEVKDLGLEDILAENNSVTVIEWPEIAESILPDNIIKIRFTDLGDNKRKIELDKL